LTKNVEFHFRLESKIKNDLRNLAKIKGQKLTQFVYALLVERIDMERMDRNKMNTVD